MKKKMLMLAVLLTVLMCGLGPLQAKDKTFSVTQVKEDLEYLYKTFNEVHPALVDPAKQEALKKCKDALMETIDTPKTAFQVFCHFAPMVSHLKDVHTMMNLPMPEGFDITRYLPADFMVIGGKVFIKHIYPEDKWDCTGAELLSVNGIAAEELKNWFFGLMPGETAAFEDLLFESNNIKMFLKELKGGKDNYRLAFKKGNVEKTCVLPALAYKKIREQRKKQPKKKQEIFSLTFKGQCAVFKIGDFTRKKFAKYLARSFARMKEKGISKLVIDMRGNKGGDSENVGELLSYFISKPTAVLPKITCRAGTEFKKNMKKRIPGVLRWLPVQKLDKRGRKIWNAPAGSLVDLEDNELVRPKPASKRFNGDLVVLVNGESISCGSLFPYHVKKWKLGRVAGTETGSLDDGAYGEAIILFLPNTKIPYQLSTMILRERPDQPPAPKGLMPDIEILRDIRGEIKGTDSQLEKALELLAAK